MSRIWNRSRGLIATSLLATLLVGATGLAYQAYQYRLPDPATADRQGLMKWMVLRDMKTESAEVQDCMVDRLEGELRLGVDLKRVDSEVSEQRRERFWRNVDILLERWYLDRAEEFQALPESRRADYIHTTVDDVLQWQFVLSKREEYAEQGGDSALLERCEQIVFEWRDAARPEAAESYSVLLIHIKADLMWRRINGTF